MAKQIRVSDPVLAEGVRRARAETGLSQRRFGMALADPVAEQTVYKWEHDETTPSVPHLRAIKELSGLSWNRILGC